MRLHPGLNYNFTVIQHVSLWHKLFQLKVDKAGEAEKTDKGDKTSKADNPFRLPAGVVRLSNNSCLTSIIAMMPVFNAHCLDQTWAEPDAAWVQEFFDNLSKRPIREEPQLIHDTTDEEVAYIASRAEEATLAKEASNIGFMEDEANT